MATFLKQVSTSTSANDLSTQNSIRRSLIHGPERIKNTVSFEKPEFLNWDVKTALKKHIP